MEHIGGIVAVVCFTFCVVLRIVQKLVIKYYFPDPPLMGPEELGKLIKWKLKNPTHVDVKDNQTSIN